MEKLQTTENTMSIQDMKDRYTKFTEFSKSILKDKLDYGIIPWVNKPSLLKPGAEKLRVFYGLWVKMERTWELLDLEKDFYDVSYMATVTNKEWLVMAQCEWSANTNEDKYKYSWIATTKKPSKEEAEKMKAQKIGRWSKNWNDRVWMEKTNATNRLSLKNTIQKMAQKRAFVWAILMATGASEFYTQDVEDMNIGGAEVVEVVEEVKQEEKPVEKEEKKEKPRFNSPEYKELAAKKAFIASFPSSQALIDEIEKGYRISSAMKMDLWDLWSDNAPENNQAPTEDSNIDDLPF